LNLLGWIVVATVQDGIRECLTNCCLDLELFTRCTLHRSGDFKNTVHHRVYGTRVRGDSHVQLTGRTNGHCLEARAGIAPYQGGFLLHYLDALVYPNIPPGLLTGIGVAICVINLGIYALRFQRRQLAGW